MRHNNLYSLSICLFLCIGSASCQTTEKNQNAISTLSLNRDKVAILSIEVSSSNTYEKSDEYNTTCKQWSLTKKDILEIIKVVKPISMHDFMYLYNVLPCEVKGELKVGDVEYNYTINAGAFMKLSTKDTTYYFGCSAKECEKYFLSTGGDPNRDLGE